MDNSNSKPSKRQKQHRLTPEDFHELAQARGSSWIGTGNPMSRDKTQWQCPEGHQWETPYFSIQADSGCPECGKLKRRPRTSANTYIEEAAKWGLSWLETEPQGVDTPTKWLCSKGHEFKATLSNVRKGALCPICGEEKRVAQRRHNPDKYYELAEKQGLKWLGPPVKRVMDLTEWECSCGHRWLASFSNIQQSYLCPICGIQKSADSRRTKPESYHQLAAERGFKWLGPEVPRVQIKTQWQCANGHTWEAAYNTIQQGSGCPECAIEIRAAKRRLRPEDYQALASERGLTIIEGIPRNNSEKAIWVCDKGHQWEATYNTVKKSGGCGHCSGAATKLERDYHALAQLNGFEWIGVELPFSTHTPTLWECNNGHVWETSYFSIQSGYGCHYCSGNARKSENDYHALARERGFQWIGDLLPKNVKEKTTWQCSQAHIWKQNWSTIQRGNGCPFCGVVTKAESNRLKAKDYHALALKKGILWVGGKVPKSVHLKTAWGCGEGHFWETSYQSIKYSYYGCPTCRGLVNGIRISSQQAWVCDYVDGEMNVQVGNYFIDIAVKIDGYWIAIEYDGWFWHRDRLEQDEVRSHDLINAGWKVLRIKSNELVPTKQEIDAAIIRLLDGPSYEEIILPDWGENTSA